LNVLPAIEPADGGGVTVIDTRVSY